MFEIYSRCKSIVKYAFALTLLLTFANAYSQASIYGFTQEQGIFTPLDNPTIIAEPTAQLNDGSIDSQSYQLNLPFQFSFAGQSHTSLWVYADGFITFGPTILYGNSPISNSNTSTPVAGAIAPMATDLHAMYNLAGITGNISYEVIGEAPNREFVIQWLHFKPYSGFMGSTSFYDCSFQLRLKENNNISIVYDLNITGSPTSFISQVGLRGATISDFNNRYSVSTWANSTRGGSNTSTISTNSTALPPAGFTFNYTAPGPCVAPTEQPTGFSATVNGIIVSGSFTAASPVADQYLIIRTPQGTEPNAPVNGTAYTVGQNTALNAQVVQISSNTIFTDNATTNSIGNTNYTYTIYAVSTACTGAPIYNLVTPLQGNATTCPGPTNTFSGVNISQTGFDITWTPNNGNALPLTYIVEVATNSDFSSPIAGSPFTVAGSETSHSVNGLTPGTRYYFRIKSQTTCGTSVVSSSKNIYTLCAPIAEINENFNALTNNTLPMCWEKIIRGASTSSVSVGANTYSGVGSTVCMSIYNASSTPTIAGNDAILVSPQLTNLAAGTHWLRFKARKNSAAEGNELEIGTLTNNSTTAVFTPITASINLTTEYVYYTVDFSDYVGTDQFIGFRKAGSSNSTYAYIDDVVWEAIPTCLTPLNIIAEDIVHNSATISWQFDPAGTAPAEGYEYYISTVATPPAADAEVEIATNTIVSAEGLTTNTTYYVFVRSVCSDTDKSAWGRSVASFTTKLVMSVPWTEGFTTTSTPAGWTTSGWQIGTSRGASGNAGNNIYKNLYSGSNATGNFSTVNVGPLPAEAELSFDYKQSDYDPLYDPLETWGRFEIQVSTDFGTSWVTLETVDNEEGNGSYISKTFSLADYEGDVVKIKINATRTEGDFDLSFDNFKIAGPTASTDNFAKKTFTIYPNPVSDVLNISTNAEIKAAKLYTLTGQLAGTYTTNTINVSGLPAGAYILTIEMADGSTGTQKVIKN